MEAEQQVHIGLIDVRSLSRSLQRDILNLVVEPSSSGRKIVHDKIVARAAEMEAALKSLAVDPAFVSSDRPRFIAAQWVIIGLIRHASSQAEAGDRRAGLATFRDRVRRAKRQASLLADRLIAGQARFVGEQLALARDVDQRETLTSLLASALLANSAPCHASRFSGEEEGRSGMSGRIIKALIAATLTATSAAAVHASPAAGGTVAITAPPTSNGDPKATISIDAASRAFGLRGFTILNDPAHAAFVAEVITTRTAVGTAVAQGRAGKPLATGGGVNIPISNGKFILAPLQRTRVEIRIHRRGEQTVLWHGAAVTVRSTAAPDGGTDQVAFALSQAALSSYPTETAGPISVP